MLHDRNEPDHRHLSDEQLLLLADGELSSARVGESGRHLECCWACRGRLLDLQNTVASFARHHQSAYEHALPPLDAPLALLRVRLRELQQEKPVRRFIRWHGALTSRPCPARRWASLAAVGLLAAFLFLAFEQRHRLLLSVPNLAAAEPLASLTPGEAALTSARDVCSRNPEDINVALPLDIRQRVFAAYGLAAVRQEDFEVDYLITPNLGGATSLKNLWPEPYFHTAWNAHVKDQLERHLRNLVCNGQLDLASAQRALSAGWIASYKKYFRTPTPLVASVPQPSLLALLHVPVAAGIP